MADNTVIAASVKIDVSAGAKQMSDLNKIISEQKKIWKDAEIGSKEYVEAQKKIAEAQQKYNQIAKETAGNADKQKESFGVLKGKISEMIPQLKAVEGGVSSFGAQLKLLAANPIILVLTAIVAVLGFLYEAFASTVEGGKKLEQVFNGVKAVVQVVTDRLFSLGNAIIKFFTGDFKGAANDAKATVSGIGDEITTVFNETQKITKRLQEIRKAEREDRVDKSEREKRLALLREQLNDESISIQERKKIAKELRDDQIKNAAEDLARTKEKAELQIKQFKMQKDGERKHADEIAELQIEINKTETENALEGVRTNKVIRNLEKQERQQDLEARKKEKEEEKLRIANLKEFELKDQKAKQEIGLAQLKEGLDKELKIISNKNDEEKRDNQLAFEQKKLNKQQLAILNKDADDKADAERKLAREKANQQELEATRKFQTELSKIELEIRIAGIEDAREKERIQLEIAHSDKLKQVEDEYKNDAARLSQIRLKLDEQFQQQKKALEKKFEEEDIKAAEQLSFKKIAFELTQAKKSFAVQEKLLDEKTELIKAQYKREIEEAGLTAQKKAEIDEKYTEDLAAQTQARKELAKAEMDAKIAAADGIASTLENAAKLFGEQTALGKTLAIASATISMFTSAQKAYESTVGIPIVGPVLAPINAGLAIATGIKNIQSIAAVEVPGASGGGGSVSAPSAPIAPAQTSTKLDAQSIQGVGNAAVAGVGRTFVLDSDINNSEERKRRIVRAARLQ
jgi:hypothetical protein